MSMREVRKQVSIRVPDQVSRMIDDVLQEGIYDSRTDFIIDAIVRYFEDLTVTETEVKLRTSLTTGDYANLRRLVQLDGGTVELWAQRLINLYSLPHAKLLAEQVDDWEAAFEKKRRLEERTESMVELRKR
jgi:Arc/MetJ-type ribon-helix-helix transcriptional regulator